MKTTHYSFFILFFTLFALLAALAVTGCDSGSSSAPVPVPGPLEPRNTHCNGNRADRSTFPATLADDRKSAFTGGDSGEYVSNEILIRFADGVSEAAIFRIVAETDGIMLNRATRQASVSSRWQHVQLPEGTSVAAAIADYAQRDEVAFVQPNYIYHNLTTLPNDTHFDRLWGLKNTGQVFNAGLNSEIRGAPGKDMNMEAAWKTRTDCSSVVVAVLDSGVQYNQVDLLANMWIPGGGTCTLNDGRVISCPYHGYNFVDRNNDPMDTNGHGTHVAGTIGAIGNNALGSTGVCWQVQIMAVRVMDTLGRGTTASVIQGIDFAIDNGANILNLSLGAPSYDYHDDRIFFDAMKRARDAGLIAVVAAGNAANNNDDYPIYPASFDLDNIISVAAMTPAGELADISNYGKISVDIAAPGTFIKSTYPLDTVSTVDDFTGWSGFADGQWGYGQCGPNRVDVLSNPDDFCENDEPVYEKGVMRTSKTFFDLSGADVATMFFIKNYKLNTDRVDLKCVSGTRDPFGPNGTLIERFRGESEDYEEWFVPSEHDLSKCIGTSSSIGLELNSLMMDPDSVKTGWFALARFTLERKTFNTNLYRYANGTSMAAPHVAGLSALLWAEYPEATAYQVIMAILDSGNPMDPEDAEKTCTGSYVNAARAIEILGKFLQN